MRIRVPNSVATVPIQLQCRVAKPHNFYVAPSLNSDAAQKASAPKILNSKLSKKKVVAIFSTCFLVTFYEKIAQSEPHRVTAPLLQN
jgi:hypothetical protein